MFEAARRLTTWHYHWLVVNEFLPQIVGQDMVDRVLRRGRRLYTPARGEAFIPVEFQTGTYRMGHSMVRPSWYYVLKEAEIFADGLHLGPVGGRIVAEVLIGLLQSDPDSYLAMQPRWRPTLPAKRGTFGMTDFLTFAGVDPQPRGQ